ncbi:MAG: hypothetical protein AB7K09_13700 [Planctomycetota bacterium]
MTATDDAPLQYWMDARIRVVGFVAGAGMIAAGTYRMTMIDGVGAGVSLGVIFLVLTAWAQFVPMVRLHADHLELRTRPLGRRRVVRYDDVAALNVHHNGRRLEIESASAIAAEAARKRKKRKPPRPLAIPLGMFSTADAAAISAEVQRRCIAAHDGVVSRTTTSSTSTTARS